MLSDALSCFFSTIYGDPSNKKITPFVGKVGGVVDGDRSLDLRVISSNPLSLLY